MKLFKNISSQLKKILVFFNPDSIKDWYSECTIKETPQKPGRYYLDLLHEAYNKKNFDQDGIPLFTPTFSFNLNYHPTYICHYALGLYEQLYRDNYNNDIIKNKFLKQADWFLFNTKTHEKGVAWSIESEYPELHLNIGWNSAMTQGEVISILTRAYLLTNEEKYIKCAEKVLWVFTTSVKDKGVVNYFDGNIIYEEFPTTKTCCALNGFIFSLFGLYDLSLIPGHEEAKELFINGANSVIKLLKYFDLGYWSQYWLYNTPEVYHASFGYHVLHIEQLKALSVLTGNLEFLEYSDKWYKYTKNNLAKAKVVIYKILKEHS